MNNLPRPQIVRVSWSQQNANLGDTVTLTTSLTGVDAPTTVTFVISECVTRPTSEGGGYRTREVATLAANVAAGASEARVEWRVGITPDDGAPLKTGIPAYRFRATLPEGAPIYSSLLSIGAVTEVTWVALNRFITRPLNPNVQQINFRPDEPVGLRLRGSGLNGFAVNFRIYAQAPDPVAEIAGVPLQAGEASTTWLPTAETLKLFGSGPYSFSVEVEHPQAAQKIAPQGQQSGKACGGSPDAYICVVRPDDGTPFYCDETDPKKGLECEAVSKSKSKTGETDLSASIQWINRNTKTGTRNLGPQGPIIKYIYKNGDATDLAARNSTGEAKLALKPRCHAWEDSDRKTKYSASERLLARFIMAEGNAATRKEKEAIAFTAVNRTLTPYDEIFKVKTIEQALAQGSTAQFDEEGLNYRKDEGVNTHWAWYQDDDTIPPGPMRSTTDERGVGPKYAKDCSECLNYKEALEVARGVLNGSIQDPFFNEKLDGEGRVFYLNRAKPPQPPARNAYTRQMRDEPTWLHTFYGINPKKPS